LRCFDDRPKNKKFNLGKLKKTTVSASSGPVLLMTFAKDIGLIEALERVYGFGKDSLFFGDTD